MTAPVFHTPLEKCTQSYAFPNQTDTITVSGTDIRIYVLAFGPAGTDYLTTGSSPATTPITCTLQGASGSPVPMTRVRAEISIAVSASAYVYELAVPDAPSPATYDLFYSSTSGTSNFGYAAFYVTGAGLTGVKNGRASSSSSSPSSLALTAGASDSLLVSFAVGASGGIGSFTPGSGQTQQDQDGPATFPITFAVSTKTSGTAGSVSVSEAFSGAPQQIAHVAFEVLPVGGGGGATAITLTGPSGGTVSVASTNFTVGADGAITGTVVVTPAASGGTFSPTSVSISSGSPTGTFTFTPTSTGAKTVSVTNNGSLTNPTSIVYTAAAAGSARSVSVILTSNGTTPVPSLTGLKWAWFDQVTPNLFAAPTDKGTGETTDGSGVLTISLPGSALSVGGIGWLEVTDSDGTTSMQHKGYSGPCAVA